MRAGGMNVAIGSRETIYTIRALYHFINFIYQYRFKMYRERGQKGIQFSLQHPDRILHCVAKIKILQFIYFIFSFSGTIYQVL